MSKYERESPGQQPQRAVVYWYWMDEGCLHFTPHPLRAARSIKLQEVHTTSRDHVPRWAIQRLQKRTPKKQKGQQKTKEIRLEPLEVLASFDSSTVFGGCQVCLRHGQWPMRSANDPLLRRAFGSFGELLSLAWIHTSVLYLLRTGVLWLPAVLHLTKDCDQMDRLMACSLKSSVPILRSPAFRYTKGFTERKMPSCKHMGEVSILVNNVVGKRS